MLEKGIDILPTARIKKTIVIASYEMMDKKKEDLKKIAFNVIIFDESHSLKDEKAKRTKAAMELASSANRVILLSATPALSCPAELYTQIKMVNKKLFPNFQDFVIRYCDGRKVGNYFVTNGATRQEEFSSILPEAIIIRRTKDILPPDVALKPKRRFMVVLCQKTIDAKMEELDAKEKAVKKKKK
uniref:Helicase ATP-binding domain-containing protein n=1 Tax=Panagrolaimus sp. ES5 TaxID=591445 RepID=A0AC34GAF9_9BILA